MPCRPEVNERETLGVFLVGEAAQRRPDNVGIRTLHLRRRVGGWVPPPNVGEPGPGAVRRAAALSPGEIYLAAATAGLGRCDRALAATGRGGAEFHRLGYIY